MDCFVLSSRPDLYSIRRWRRIQYLSDQFWRRWQREYCLLQQKRKKWYDVSPNSHVGDIVLISNKSCPRNQCRPLARVTEVYPSEDGLVRKVLLLVTQSGKKKLLERPIHKLILIFRPNEDESDARLRMLRKEHLLPEYDPVGEPGLIPHIEGLTLI